MEGKLGSDMIFTGGVRWALGCEGVIVRFSLPGNTEQLEPSDIQASIFASAEAKGYARSAISEQLPVGNRYGPWEQTMAAQLADELVVDDMLTIYRPDEDAHEVDLPVFVLTPFGTKYTEDGKPRGYDPQKAREREERDQRRLVMYVEYPKLNMDEAEKCLLVSRLKDKITLHLMMTHNAESVGFCDARDKYDNPVCKFLVFVHHRKEDQGPGFFARALPGIKFINMGVHNLAKVKIPGRSLQKLNLRPCCFLQKCSPKPGSEFCGAMSRAYDERKGGQTKQARDDARDNKRKAQKLENNNREEKVARMRGAKVVECRAFLIGRCRKDDCPAAHLTDPKQIDCCTKRFGTPSFKKRLDKCPMSAAD